MEIIEEQFTRLYQNILVKKKQRNDGRKKYKNVIKTLHKYYYSNDYDGSTKLVFGSFGKHTNIRPPRDVDVIFKIPDEYLERYKSHTSNGPSQLLQDIRQVLDKRFTTTEKIRAWGKVVLVEFSNNKHNVEVLPGWENEDGTFIIPNTENGGSWEAFDPRDQLNKVRNQNNSTNGVTRKLIRMVKKWTSNCTVNIKSVDTENYVMNFLSTTDITVNTSALVKNFFVYLKGVIDNSNLSYVETALNRSQKALDFEKESKEEDAIEEWVKVFGESFPKTIEKSLAVLRFNERLEILKSNFGSAKEQYLDIDYNIRTEINPNYNIKIDCEVILDGFRNHFLSYFIRKGWLLAKSKELKFKVIENNVPEPYVIMWKVRNFGDEAAQKDQLRGEITRDKGKNEKVESTAYEGEHYVECYCIKNNICVAKDKIFVPIGDYE